MPSSSPQHPILTSEAVAALPPPGLSGPSSIVFSPCSKGREQQQHSSEQFLAFVASESMMAAHQPRRLQVKNSFSAVSSTSALANTRKGSGLSPSSSSSSERQLFVLNVSEVISQQSKRKRPSSSSSARKLSGPPKPHEKLPTYNSSFSSVSIYPLLRIPSSSPSNNSTASIATPGPGTNKRRTYTGQAPGNPQQQTQGIISQSIVSSSFPGHVTSLTQQQPQQQTTTATAFTNVTSSSLIHFSWRQCRRQLVEGRNDKTVSATLPQTKNDLRLLIPVRGSLYVQHGILEDASSLQLVYDKASFNPSPKRSCKTSNATSHNTTDAEDPHLSPDGRMVAFVVAGEICVVPCDKCRNESKNSGTKATPSACVQLTFGATDAISHGVADFIAQEEMDRYRGFWWHPDSNGILFTRLDESSVPNYRILHQDVGSNVGPPTATHLGAMSSGDGETLHSANTTTFNKPKDGTPSCTTYEDHRYPFAGNANPSVSLGFVKVDFDAYFAGSNSESWEERRDASEEKSGERLAKEEWDRVRWYESPREAPEYLARVLWLPDGAACAQWQNRKQNTLVVTRMNVQKAERAHTLLIERTQYWINLNHMMKPLPVAIHPDECNGTVENIPALPNPLPDGAFSFFFASERTGYCHLYLYTYVPGYNGGQAVLLKSISGDGEWMVESVVGVDTQRDLVYVMGTYDSVLERHLYALPITNQLIAYPRGTDAGDGHPNEDVDMNLIPSESSSASSVGNHGVRRGLKQVMHALSGRSRPRNSSPSAVNGASLLMNNVQPLRLTEESGMHSVVMDDDCRVFVDTSSDLDRPTTVRLFALQQDDTDCDDATAAGGGGGGTAKAEPVKAQFLLTLYDALHDEKTMTALNLATNTSAHANGSSGIMHRLISSLPAPELLSFPTSDGIETLHAALYRPDPVKHGPGPYPLVCAVYGGPHVQRVNRSWSQCADMRAQRLCSLGFCVVKCDNRGSSRRGMAFEAAVAKRLGRLEVLDQVATVRHMTLRGIADPTRVGIYGWSYGGYLSAMCLCRAPDVFHVAVAGAPVTSWDGYDTHYTERYMGLPSDNVSGYRESAVFDHVPNMRGRLMLVHGLIDENVHFRHTARLINRLIGAGKDYDLLIFPDERHSPRRLRDRIYMEQRISDYFVRHLGSPVGNINGAGFSFRSVPGHL